MGDNQLIIYAKRGNGSAIQSVEDWFDHASPKKGAAHWQDGRSAKELAKAWFRRGYAAVPEEVVNVLDSHPLTKAFIPEFAIAELQTSLDDFGGPRNHDLVLVGRSYGQKALIAFEGKERESFGEKIDSYLRREKAKPGSNVPERMGVLSIALWGRSLDLELGKLRYQLVTGLAGTLIEAKNRSAVLAVFVVHEFHVVNGSYSERTPISDIVRNSVDFDAFLRSFPSCVNMSATHGQLIEGISVRGGGRVPSNITVLLGKIVTEISLPS